MATFAADAQIADAAGAAVAKPVKPIASTVSY